jgi:hypothetical protein
MKAERTITLLFALALAVAAPARAIEWHHPLYLDGGGYWRQRIVVTVENDTDRALIGRPGALTVGNAPGAVALVGAQAESVRVCDATGEEMLFALADDSGQPQARGPIAVGSVLTIPVECRGGAKATYLVYFDNPLAGELPDFLESARPGLVNGGLERGTGPTPTGWQHDQPDAQHRTSWVSEQSQAGRKCLETVVDAGAEPSWISTRQTGLPIVAGARYVMTAWVRGDGVKGQAGWYIHVGNRENPMLVNPVLNAGEGTFGWTRVSAEFTAPADADLADLGTVLRGTGTAWFDSASLTCLEQPKVRAVAATPERLDVRESGGDAPWLAATVGTPVPEHRAAVKVINLGQANAERTLVSVDLALLVGRTHGRLDRRSIRVVSDGKTVAAHVVGDRLLFPARVPARSVRTHHVYFSERADASSEPATLSTLDLSYNLVKNAGFEKGRLLPEGWTNTGPSAGVTFAVDDPGRASLGARCARMTVATTAPKTWRGWNQDVPVKPGRTYLIAAWVKCTDVSGDVNVHAHRQRADGSLVSSEPMISIGPPISGTTGWTLMAGTSTMPADAATLRLHLTTDLPGTLWHDNVVVAEVTSGTIVGLEHLIGPAAGTLQVWQVPAVVKVFPDDGPPAASSPARITTARNEREPLQLALQSARALSGLKISAAPPVGPGGATLADVQVGVVGYVPIDHPTNYYQSKTPAWHRKYPKGGAGSDGWAGLWPDPILPRATVDLAAGRTQPVWITVGVGKTRPAGDYCGAVRLDTSDGQLVATVPYTVHVHDFTLPDESHVKAIYDVSLGQGEALWKMSHRQAYQEVAPFMAHSRLSPDRIVPDPPFRYRDGKATADFTIFDAAARRYFDEWKLPHSYMPNFFYMFGWGFPPKDVLGEHPYEGPAPYDAVDRGRLRPEYKAAYQACLKLFWDHVKAQGWQDRFVLYISDEPFYDRAPIRKQMVALCAMIHEVDRKIPIYSSTWHHVPEWDGALDIWGIGHYGVVPVEQMAKIRAGGAKIWFTTDGHMCTDTPYCAIERLLPYFCFHYGAEAYEFWSVAWLTYDPYKFGWHAYIHQTDAPGQSYYVRYPNGDGFLLYPGAPVGHAGPVSSVRFEQAREGVEDYEWLVLLRDLATKARAAGRDTSQADAALKAVERLTPIPNAGGRYSTKLLPDPQVLYDVREAVARAIEALERPG